MSAPNDFRFTSSNKEKVALLINRKQGENYHMRPVKTRHTGFSVIVTTAVRAREVYISRGLPSEAPRHNVWERNQLTDYDQIELSPFCCHCWGRGGRERRIESVRGRHRGTTSECVCLKVESIDYYQDRCATLLLRCRVVYVCVCLRENPVDRLVSRSRCHPTPSVLGSVCGGGRGQWHSHISTLIKNRVGDDGVPAILQYRPSDLYPTDRKETMAILQKDTHTPLRICK